MENKNITVIYRNIDITDRVEKIICSEETFIEVDELLEDINNAKIKFNEILNKIDNTEIKSKE